MFQSNRMHNNKTAFTIDAREPRCCLQSVTSSATFVTKKKLSHKAGLTTSAPGRGRLNGKKTEQTKP